MREEGAVADSEARTEDLLREAVAAKLHQRVWPRRCWEEADVQTRAICRDAARVALAALRMRHRLESVEREGSRSGVSGLGDRHGRAQPPSSSSS